MIYYIRNTLFPFPGSISAGLSSGLLEDSFPQKCQLHSLKPGSSDGGIKACAAAARPSLCSVSVNSYFFGQLLSKRKNYIFRIF